MKQNFDLDIILSREEITKFGNQVLALNEEERLRSMATNQHYPSRKYFNFLAERRQRYRLSAEALSEGKSVIMSAIKGQPDWEIHYTGRRYKEIVEPGEVLAWATLVFGTSSPVVVSPIVERIGSSLSDLTRLRFRGQKNQLIRIGSGFPASSRSRDIPITDEERQPLRLMRLLD